MELIPGAKKQITVSKIGISFLWDANVAEVPLNLDFSAMIMEKKRYKAIVNYKTPKIDFVEWIPDLETEERSSGFIIDLDKAGKDIDSIMLFGFISFAESRKQNFSMLNFLEVELKDLSNNSEEYAWRKKTFSGSSKANGIFTCQLSKRNDSWEFKITDTLMELPNFADLIKAYK